VGEGDLSPTFAEVWVPKGADAVGSRFAVARDGWGGGWEGIT
jgi:hypothetical protein